MREVSWLSIAISASVAVTTAWVLSLVVEECPGWVRMSVVVVLPAICATTVIIVEQYRRATERAVRRTLDRLLQAEQEISGAMASPLDERRTRGSQWKGVVSRAKHYVKTNSERLLEAEQFRAKAEVRARNMETEHGQITEIISNLDDPVVAVNQYGDLVLANANAEQLFGFDIDAGDSKAARSLIRCEQLVGLLSETMQHRSTAQRTGELELSDAAGEKHWYRVTCRAAGEKDGADSGAVAVLRDISVQKAMQQRNAEFVSAVSHEMKTPLTSIKAYVELLADIEPDDEQTRDEFLDVINGQADRLQRLIDNLLNIARIEAGVVKVSKTDQSLNEILEEAFGIVFPAAERKSIRLKRELSPLYLGVFADRDMLLQAAINLLSNAVKYTPDEGAVVLRSRMSDSSCVFEVEDTGVGLSPQDSKNVFQKFYRVKQQQGMAKGTGLGLPLAKHIVEDVHGGCIEVESELGKGSTFRIRLPNVESGKI